MQPTWSLWEGERTESCSTCLVVGIVGNPEAAQLNFKIQATRKVAEEGEVFFRAALNKKQAQPICKIRGSKERKKERKSNI